MGLMLRNSKGANQKRRAIMKTITKTVAMLLVLLLLPVSASARTLIPGGQLLGLQLYDDRVTVAKLDESLTSGKVAGLRPGDQITHIDGIAVTNAADIRKALESSDGSVVLTVLREGKTVTLTAQPDITPEGPRLGVYLKEGITGVGTVTWYDPETGEFAALGHSVNNASGQLMKMTDGSVYRAKVLSVKKGKTGTPGQLLGSMDANVLIGELEKNTQQGVFGTLCVPTAGTPLETAQREQIRTGDAVILSTVAADQVQEYSVKILKIYPNTKEQGRNMLIKVTDPELLNTTGGIVQGMGVSYNKDNQWNP